MHRKFIASVGAIGLLAPLFTSALTNDQIATQVQSLLQQVSQLQSQLAQNAATGGSGNGCMAISRVLAYGARGSDVLALQKFLISQNLLSADSATGFYGSLTQSAVQKYQTQQNIISSGTPATTGWGTVGPRTRAALNLCGTAPVGGIIQVSPVSGNPPLAVTVTATVNTLHSCASAVYMIDYGDGSERTLIRTQDGNCNDQTQTYPHTYTTSGTYKVALSAGDHASATTVTVGNGLFTGALPGTLVPSQQDVPLPQSFTVPGDIQLSLGGSGVSGTFSIRLDGIQTGATGNGGLVGTSAQISAKDGGTLYQPALSINAPTLIGNYMVTLKTLSTTKATFNIAPYNQGGGTSTGIQLSPGVGGNTSAVSAKFGLATACTRYDLDWGEGTTTPHATQAQGTCAAGQTDVTLSHTYSSAGSFTVTLKRGPDLSQKDSASITITQ